MKNEVTINVDMKEVDRVCIGAMLYDALNYENADNIYGLSGSGISSLTLSKTDIVKLIKLVNKNNMFRDITQVEVID